MRPISDVGPVPAGQGLPERGWWPWTGFVVLAFALATITHADADLWGHVRFGLDFLQSGELPSVDPYSFAQDRPWLNHEWLSEAIMAAAYRAAGPAGLALLKASLATAVFWIVWGSLRRARHTVRVAALAWLMLGAVHMVSSIRPQLWSFVAMAILCRTLAEREGRLPRWLPLLFAVWANLHGGWIVGLGILLTWIIAGLMSEARSWQRQMSIGAACVLATLGTPYGWKLWQFMWQTIGFERSIVEWWPLWKAGGVAAWVAWAGTTAAVMADLSRKDSHRWARSAVLALLAYASFRVMRIGSLYVTTALILLAPRLAAIWPVRPQPLARGRSRWEPLVAALPSALALIAAARVGADSLSCVRSDGPWAPDPEVVARLSTAAPGRLVTYFDWGEYAIWHLGPSIRVSIDGRRETVYSESHLALHDRVVQGTAEGLAALAAWRPDYVWLPASSIQTKQWLVLNGYSMDLLTPRSFLASRRPITELKTADGPPERKAARRCFPD